MAPADPQEVAILAVFESNIQSLTGVFAANGHLSFDFGDGDPHISFRIRNRLSRVVDAKWQVECARRTCLDNEKSLAQVRSKGKGV